MTHVLPEKFLENTNSSYSAITCVGHLTHLTLPISQVDVNLLKTNKKTRPLLGKTLQVLELLCTPETLVDDPKSPDQPTRPMWLNSFCQKPSK